MSSLERRYAAKLAANTGGLLASALVVLLVPRSLGAANYGQAEFLLAFFAGVVGVMELGTSIGFYAWLSRKPDNVGLVRGYIIVALGVYCVLIGLVLLAFAAGAPAKLLWPGATLLYVAAGSLAAWLAWVQQMAQKTLDARGLTVRGEIRILFVRLAAVGLIAALVVRQLLTLNAYFSYLIFMPLITVCLLVFVLRGERISGEKFWPAVKRSKLDWGSLYDYFKPYIVPMLGFNIVTTSALLLDRWLLQRVNGAAEQGLFSLGSRIATLCFLFSAAMAQLLTREFALAWEDGNTKEVGRLFARYVPPLYAMSALIASFVAWHGEQIALILGGREFAAGGAAVTVFAFYPMHQTLGQLTGAVFYATANMKVYARNGIVGAVAGLPLLWFLVGPANAGGLALGSLGLAIKMLMVQIIFVNVLVFLVARQFGLNFGRQLVFQIVTPAACILFAMVSAWLAALMLPVAGITSLLLSGMLYLGLAILLLTFVPGIFGVKREDLHRILAFVRVRLRSAANGNA